LGRRIMDGLIIFICCAVVVGFGWFVVNKL
jgi:hypothetical protein